MLRELRNYIRENREVSLRDSAIHFKSEESLIESLVLTLENKGLVERVAPESCFKASQCSCKRECAPNNGVILRWKG